MSENSFSFSARVKSFSHALSGLRFMLATQHNAWVHLVATLAAIGAGLWLHIAPNDWRWLIVAIVLVWVAEAMNTAFEHLCDVVSPQFHASVQRSKDIAAGAVLICALGAALLGLAIFWPYLAPLISSAP